MTSFTEELLLPTRAVTHSLYQNKPKHFMEGHQSAVYTQGEKNLKPLTWMFWGGGPCPVCLDLTMCILEFAAVTNLELSPRKGW